MKTFCHYFVNTEILLLKESVRFRLQLTEYVHCSKYKISEEDLMQVCVCVCWQDVALSSSAVSVVGVASVSLCKGLRDFVLQHLFLLVVLSVTSYIAWLTGVSLSILARTWRQCFSPALVVQDLLALTQRGWLATPPMLLYDLRFLLYCTGEWMTPWFYVLYSTKVRVKGRSLH